MSDHASDESKIVAQDPSPTGDELIDRIGKLDLSSNKRERIAAIALNSAGFYVDLCGGKDIDDIGAVAIGEGLSNNSTLKELHIYAHNIGDVGAAAIGEGLGKNSTLQKLFLQQNKIGDVGAAAIGEGLSKNSTLEILSLYMNEISDAGATAIAEGLRKNSTLQSLYLMWNNISDVGVAAIGEALSTNSTLQKLSVDENKITETGCLILAKCFRLNENMTQMDASPEGTIFTFVHVKKVIGSGEFGSVSLAETDDLSQVVAKTSHSGSKREEVYERLILQGLPEHRNIVRLAAFDRNDALLLEAHKGGSLKDYARKQQDGTPLPQFLSYSHGMCLAIEHLHKHGILHRDIAARNYVLTEDLETPVLVDFGLSWPIQEEKHVMIRPQELMPFRQCAPEVLSVLQYSKGADIWQLGLAMWQLLHRGKQPFFYVANCQQLVERLKQKMVQDKAHIPLHFKKNGAAQDLITTVKEVVVFCCSYDPDKRPTATQVSRKIESLRASAGSEAEEKEVSRYAPSDNDISDGLMAYNYTDYQNLKTEGRSDYVDLKKNREEYENDELEVFPEVTVEEDEHGHDEQDEGGDDEEDKEQEEEQEHGYQELETLPTSE